MERHTVNLLDKKLLAGLFLVVGSFVGSASAGPAGPPAGLPILNQHQYQQNSEMNIDTATIRSLNISTITNTPAFASGFVLGGVTYYSLSAVNAILNQSTRQANSVMNIDTATIVTVTLSTFTNIPNLPLGINVQGATYNSIGVTGEGPSFTPSQYIAIWTSNTNYSVGDFVRKSGAGELYYSVINNNLNFALPNKVSDSNWHYLAEANPIGTILAYINGTMPYGYLLCDGSAVSRTTYADLFILVGTTYGSGDGSTTFNLPDIRGKTLAGMDGVTFTALGVSTGSLTHQHSIATQASATTDQVADAPHTLPIGNDPAQVGLLSIVRAGSWTGATATVASMSFNSVVAAGINAYTKLCQSFPGIGHTHHVPAHNHGGSTGATSNIQPTMTINYMIRAL